VRTYTIRLDYNDGTPADVQTGVSWDEMDRDLERLSLVMCQSDTNIARLEVTPDG
jgi:hypothetical protein